MMLGCGESSINVTDEANLHSPFSSAALRGTGGRALLWGDGSFLGAVPGGLQLGEHLICLRSHLSGVKVPVYSMIVHRMGRDHGTVAVALLFCCQHGHGNML